MNQYDVSKADDLFDKGLVSELNDFIKPFLDNEDPYAYYFSSKYSLSEWGESDEEFDQRRFSFLTKASEHGVAEAMYQLSALYFSGDTVSRNEMTGKNYLDKALALNFEPAKLSVGMNLFYGTNGYQQDIDRAIVLVTDAVDNNVDGAESVLNSMNQQEQ